MTFDARTLGTGAVVAMLAAHRREWVLRHDETAALLGDAVERRVEVEFELPAIAWASVPRDEPVVVPLGMRPKGRDSPVDVRDESGGAVATLPPSWTAELAVAGLMALAAAAGVAGDDARLARLVWPVVEAAGDDARKALDELALSRCEPARRAWAHPPFRAAAQALAAHRLLLVALDDAERRRVLTYAYDEPADGPAGPTGESLYERLADQLDWEGLRLSLALPHLGDSPGNGLAVDAGDAEAEVDIDHDARSASVRIRAPAALAVRFGPLAGGLAALALTGGWLAAPSLDGRSSAWLLLLGLPAVGAAYVALRPEPGVSPVLLRGARTLLLAAAGLALVGEALLASGATTAALRVSVGLLAVGAWVVALLLGETWRRARGGAAPSPAPRAEPPPARDERPWDPARVAWVALAMGAGLMVVALADHMARNETGGAGALFWAGLLVIFLPAVLHAWRGPPRVEALVGAILAGLSLYLVKVLHSPLYFTFHDEFSTLRTTVDIERFGKLFEPNPLIEVHPVYPGLELVTSGVSSVTGLSTFVSALVVVGLLRIALMAALFLIFEAVASTRVAAIGTVLYACNPSFVFFDSQWAYESFALPLALVAVALAAQGRRGAWLAIPFVLALCVSHPLTTIALIAFLLVWARVDAGLARRSDAAPRSELWVLAAVAAGALTLWAAFVAKSLGGYLGPVIGDAGNSFVDLLLGEAGPKRIFGAAGAGDTPLLERLAGYGAVLLALAAVGFGMRPLLKRLTPLAGVLALTALVYPLSLPLRLTEAGTEISNRASEFVFVGVALLAALALTERAAGRITARAVAGLAAVAMVGGVVIGTAPWARLPGGYEVVADESSVEPEGRAAAMWARGELGPGNRIFTDRVNALLMGSLGLQDPQVGHILGRPLSSLFTSPTLSNDVRFVVSKDKIGYLVVDKRLATERPAVGFYFDRVEPGAYRHERPMALRGLLKWDLVCPVGRVFDSGSLVVYDTRRMSLTGECPASGDRGREEAR
jgi:hypothetical protein